MIREICVAQTNRKCEKYWLRSCFSRLSTFTFGNRSGKCSFWFRAMLFERGSVLWKQLLKTSKFQFPVVKTSQRPWCGSHDFLWRVWKCSLSGALGTACGKVCVVFLPKSKELVDFNVHFYDMVLEISGEWKCWKLVANERTTKDIDSKYWKFMGMIRAQ